ncbi:DUF2924 domain-containing protein [Rubripirellula sp.]|nr:DUF2924 domain-containing protein [Rubripirellula sp.]
MTLNINQAVAEMELMTTRELRERYTAVYNEGTNARNKKWLIKRIAWRMQANAQSGLSERARRRAMEIANDADLRTMPPRGISQRGASQYDGNGPTVVHQPNIQPSRDLVPGTVLRRIYKGRPIDAHVSGDGFIYDGEHYKSLTAVAKAATGKHWNGYHFFGLRKKGAK